jgi:hypothetical protein
MKNYRFVFILLLSLAINKVSGQKNLGTPLTATYNPVIPTNSGPVGLESNILFNATKRYTVTVNNYPTENVAYLFDGNFDVYYSTVTSINSTNPAVITIENLPNHHIQAGAYFGWTTRYCEAKRFKVDAYDEYSGKNQWVNIIDRSETDYSEKDLLVKMPGGSFTKLRISIYSCVCSNIGIAFGISEMYFIHPEAGFPYEGLFDKTGDIWAKTGNNVNYTKGNVLIGKTAQANSTYKLDVDGKIRASEVVVNTDGADFVFEPDYKLYSLPELETYVKQNKHLPEIQSASEMQANGANLSELNTKLLQKVEELTLYLIEQNKKSEAQGKMIEAQNEKIKALTEKIEKLLQK